LYLITELIFFSPLIIYAGIRVRKLIPKPYHKNVFVLLYVLLFLGYPIAELFSHRDINAWARIPIIISYCGLPYLLYFTLLVVTIDFVIGLAKIAKLLHKDTISGNRFRNCRIGFCLVIPALIVSVGAINNDLLKIKEYSIDLPQKSSTIKELKIVYASDFHLGQLTNDRLVERFIAKVNSLYPDIILLGGDILEGHGNGNGNLELFENHFQLLRAKYGVYAAPGNHESHSGTKDNFFANSGINLLEDEVVSIDGAFYLVGRKDVHGLKKRPIEDLLKSASDDLPVILLDHSPTDIENVSKSRVDLQLSGHTHNGQLFPVNLLVMPFEYELPWGMKVINDTHFIVSSGIQAWGPPVKTAGDSEILFIRATFRSDVDLPRLRPRTRLAIFQLSYAPNLNPAIDSPIAADKKYHRCVHRHFQISFET
jgi:uncharacterized protein